VLQEIDVATGQMFREIGMPEVAEYDPWPLPDLEHSLAAGLLWVIPGEAGEPVAFLMGARSTAACTSSSYRSTWAAPAAGSAGRCWNTPRSARPPTGCPR
jgi:hypothetical protein